MGATIIPPAGAETYRDALGREQWRVTGPGGRYLVTSGGPSFEVWRPDSLRIAYRTCSLQRALDWAASRVARAEVA
jgi:hypothetical protein